MRKMLSWGCKTTFHVLNLSFLGGNARGILVAKYKGIFVVFLACKKYLLCFQHLDKSISSIV
jgi:hypothetical protein